MCVLLSAASVFTESGAHVRIVINIHVEGEPKQHFHSPQPYTRDHPPSTLSGCVYPTSHTKSQQNLKEKFIFLGTNVDSKRALDTSIVDPNFISF